MYLEQVEVAVVMSAANSPRLRRKYTHTHSRVKRMAECYLLAQDRWSLVITGRVFQLFCTFENISQKN